MSEKKTIVGIRNGGGVSSGSGVRYRYNRSNLACRKFILQNSCNTSSNRPSSSSTSKYIQRNHHHHYSGLDILPGFKTTSFFTILMLVCLETVLLSTVSNCAKTFYMHWNTSNSIFRIDNTDHIIDVNKGNSAFEFDQVHIICPVYEPGTYENETEKYIIYNVSKVEYETCRITNADPRVIAICDKPQKLMFFTITFRPFTPQPGGLEFLPGNDYYFISTSSKDDLYRRIGGRCSTNNMKVVFKVCCAPEQKNITTSIGSNSSNNINNNNNNNDRNNGNNNNGISYNNNSERSGSTNIGNNIQQQQHNNNINSNNNNGQGSQLDQNNGGNNNNNGGISINTNIDQFNRIPLNNNYGQQQTGIRINNMPPSSSQNPQDHHQHHQQQHQNNQQSSFIPPLTNINTNNSNVVQSTMSWPVWGGGSGNNNAGGNNGNRMHSQHSTPVTTIGLQPHFYPPYMTSSRPNINSAIHNNSNYLPSHKPTKKTNEYDKHPNEVVKNEELTYNSGASSLHKFYVLSKSRKNLNNNNLNSAIDYYSNYYDHLLQIISYEINKLFIINKLNKLLLLLIIICNSNLFNLNKFYKIHIQIFNFTYNLIINLLLLLLLIFPINILINCNKILDILSKQTNQLRQKINILINYIYFKSSRYCCCSSSTTTTIKTKQQQQHQWIFIKNLILILSVIIIFIILQQQR